MYSDLDLTLLPHPGTGDIMKKVDDEAIRGALRNILLTEIGTKAFDSYFGIGLRSVLFELNSPPQKIMMERVIREKIAFYEPRIVLEDIFFLDEEDENLLGVELLYYVVGSDTTQRVNISIERTR